MLVSFFKAKCKHCFDEFVVSTGSADECNRCRTVMTLLTPLSIYDIERLLNAMREPELRGRGSWAITWKSSEGSHG
jgi:hypothetical protein